MEAIIQIYNNLNIYIVCLLIVVVLLLLIIVIANIKAIGKLEAKYRKLTRGVDNSNLEEVINSYMNKIDDVKTETDNMKNEYSSINQRIDRCIQNISITRYKAFEDVGSDLSFSLALLDSNKDGVIITSIYGRNESTIYAKPIEKGISRYDLSEEEKMTLENTLNKK